MREEPLKMSAKKLRADGMSENSDFAMYCQLSSEVRAFFLRCPINSCGKTFIYISGLLGHLRTHQMCLTSLLGDVSSSDLESGKVTLNTLLLR